MPIDESFSSGLNHHENSVTHTLFNFYFLFILSYFLLLFEGFLLNPKMKQEEKKIR